MNYLSYRDVIGQNRELIAFTGGLGGGTTINDLSLRFVIDAVKDNEYYPTVAHKAALYCFNIITRHVFTDGNKRTGMASAINFLRINGIHLSATSDDIVAFALQLGKSEVSYEETVEWFVERIA